MSASGVPTRRSGAIARCPSAGSPAQHQRSPRTGVPSCSGGSAAAPAGPGARTARCPARRGPAGAKSRRTRSTSGASARGQKTGPPSTIGPTGWSRYSKAVAIPKLPPPPRSPQNSSGSVQASTCSGSPSAVTRSTESRLSTVRPSLRMRWPSPPPRVSPPMPVWLTIPAGVASPNALGGAVELAQQDPAGRPGGAGPRVDPDRLHQRQVDHQAAVATAWPATACPPPRTETSRSCSRAKRTASATSSAPAQRAISAGRRSMAPFQTRRASS